MGVFIVRIKNELRKKMEKYRGRINWPEEIRKYVESRSRKLEAKKTSREF
jgi:hypothetical protein